MPRESGARLRVADKLRSIAHARPLAMKTHLVYARRTGRRVRPIYALSSTPHMHRHGRQIVGAACGLCLYCPRRDFSHGCLLKCRRCSQPSDCLPSLLWPLSPASSQMPFVAPTIMLAPTIDIVACPASSLRSCATKLRRRTTDRAQAISTELLRVAMSRQCCTAETHRGVQASLDYQGG